MRAAPDAAAPLHGVPRSQESVFRWDPTVGLCVGPYRGTSLIRNSPTPEENRRALDAALRKLLESKDTHRP